MMVNTNSLTTADYNQQGTINFTGGTLYFGNAATATNFNVQGPGQHAESGDRYHDQ